MALAEKDSVVAGGHYRVSFDLGMPKDSYNKDMRYTAISKVIGGGGGNCTAYYIEIENKSINTDNQTGSFLGYLPIVTIKLEEYNKDQPILSEVLLQKELRVNMGLDAITHVKTATRLMDNTTGAVASSPHLGPGIMVYQAEYYPVFDPARLHVLILSTYFWDAGTRQLLETIHVEKIRSNETVNLNDSSS